MLQFVVPQRQAALWSRVVKTTNLLKESGAQAWMIEYTGKPGVKTNIVNVRLDRSGQQQS